MMKFSDTLCTAGMRSLFLCVLFMALVAVHGSPNGGRNALGACRDRSTSCSNMVSADCYIEDENYRCCRSCWNLSRRVSRGPGCLYGDKDPEVCRFVRARHCGGQYYKKLCCATCDNFRDSLRD